MIRLLHTTGITERSAEMLAYGKIFSSAHYNKILGLNLLDTYALVSYITHNAVRRPAHKGALVSLVSELNDVVVL